MSDNILVAVRVRPLISREVSSSPNLHWETGSDNTLTQVDPVSKRVLYTPYKFDRVFGSDFNNLDVYCEVAEPIVESALAGFNGTIFAYGQTSSGKTYTMMGAYDCPGVIPLAIRNIFSSIENTPDREYLIRVSYMEIYNENITDLLATREARSKGLSIREDTSGNVYVADLKEECVNCEESLLALMRKGDKNRHVGVTNMNERSSRSHTIFRLILESRERTEGDSSEEAVVVSQLNLVDLAGSENASQTGATGERLKEGGFINRSLFMLGRVISQLSDGDQFVNFRDSKLTRILQLSLGGNAKTAIVCTVTPVAIDQTHSTLRFASRAKSIKNKPIVNEVLSESALLKRYAKEINKLKESLKKERNTDKAQEVEQVREMLDEQARKNEDLQAKVNELKAKLVVSSLPREISKKIPEKKKARRETWAAPAIRRAMRMSMAPMRIEPLDLNHDFLRPELPPWMGLGTLSEEEPVTPALNVSSMSDGFGKQDVSYMMDLAEQSKLDALETSYDATGITGKKQKRRVQFDFSMQEKFLDAECQTDESLLPRLNLLNSPCLSTPKKSSVFSSPGTPAHVLRARNADLKQKLEDKEEWLSDWQTQLNELRDYQRCELQLLEESFQKKVADGPIDDTKLDSQAKEISSLKHSLKDSETLLLDANKELCQKTQEIAFLQEEMHIIKEENERTCGFEEELCRLREENKNLRKSLNEKDLSIKQFENDKQDFDMMMELALEKQRGKEKDLRRSLESAWEEIAGYESNNVDTVRRRSMHISEIEKELDQLRKNQAEFEKLKANNAEIQAQLEATLKKQQAAEEIMQGQNSKLQEMEILVEKLKELDEQVSRIEVLESELSQAKSEIDCKEEKNRHLQETANALQMRLEEQDIRGTPSRVRELEEELEYLREKIEEGSSTGGSSFLAPRPLPLLNITQDSALVSLEISRKLSETIQVLEESVLLPSTPNRGSVSSLDEPFQMQDFNFIKQQLLALQEALLIQDQQQQVQQQRLEEVREEAIYIHQYQSQIVAEIESENNMWDMTEALCADYIMYSESPFICAYTQTVSPLQHQPNVEDAVQAALEEAKLQFEAEYSAKLREECAELKAKLSKESSLKNEESFQVPTNFLAAPMSLADELKEAGMNMTVCNETFETSILNLETDSSQQEIKRLKQQLDLLSKENSELLHQIKQLSVGKEVPPLSCPVAQSNTAQSLADELQQAGMNMTMNMCDETFETSVLNLGADSSNQEVVQLKHQLELLNQENTQLHEEVKQLQLQRSKSQELKEDMETKMLDNVKEKEALELQLKSLEDQLSDNKIKDEEVFSLRWQIDSLKQDKSELENELQLMLDESKNMEDELNIRLKEAEAAKKELTDKLNLFSQEEQLIDSSALHKAQQQIEELQNEKQRIEEQLEKYKSTESEEQVNNENQKEDGNISGEDLFSDEYANHGHVEKMAEIKQKLDDAQKKILSLEDRYRLDSGELADLKELLASNQQLKESLAEKTRDIEEAHSKIEDLQSKNADNDHLEKLKKEFDIAKEKITKLEEAAEKQQADFEERISQVIADKDSEMEMFITNFSDKEEALEEKVKELESANLDVNEIRKTLVSKELEVQTLTADYNTLKTTVGSLEKQLIEEQNRCSDAVTKCEALHRESLDSSVEAENRIQEMKNIIASHEEQLSNKSVELEEMKNQLDEQKELLDAAEMEKQTLKELSEKKILQESYNSSKIEHEITLDRNDHSTLNDKVNELAQLKDEYAIKIKEYTQLQDCADNLKIVLANKEKELERLSRDHADELSSYIDNLQAKDEKIQELEAIIKQNSEAHTNMVMAIEAKDHKLKRLTSELEESQQSLESKDREFQSYLDAAECGVSTQVKALQEEIERLNKLHSEVCEDRKNMAEAIKEKEDIVNNLISEQSAFKKEVETVTEDLNVAKEKLKSYEEEINKKNIIISNFEVDCEKYKTHELCRDQEVEKMVGIIEKYETEISEKEGQLQIISKETNTKDLCIAEIKKELDALQRNNDDMAEELQVLKDVKERCNVLEREVLNYKEEATGADLHEKIASLESNLTVLKSEYNQRVEKYEEEISGHLSEREKLSKMLNETEAKLDEITKERNEVHEQLDVARKAMEEEAEVAKCKENVLGSKIENLEEDLESISICLTVKEEELEKQKEALKLIEEEKEKVEDELSELRDQEKALSDQLESNNSQIENLVRIIEKYETEMSEKDMQLQTEQEKYDAIKSEKEEQLQNLMTEIEVREASLKEAEEAVQSLQERNHQMLDKLEKLEDIKDKYSRVEKELIEHKNLMANLEDLPEKLKNSERNLAILQADYEEEIKKNKAEISQYMSQHEEILNKLYQTEGELQNFKELVEMFRKELQEKEEALTKKEENCQTHKIEMDNLIKQLEKAGMEIKDYKEQMALYKSQQEGKDKPDFTVHHELSSKLRRTEEELMQYKEQLEALQKQLEEKEGALKEKELECTKLDAEMDDIVQHFQKEGECKADTIGTLTVELSDVKSELEQANRKLADSMMVCNQTNKDDQTSEDDAISELQSQIKSLKEELQAKEEKCGRCNTNKDEIDEHYKQVAPYADLEKELLQYKEQLESLQKELEEKESTLKEKELNCTKLDAEMDDIVQHFEEAGKLKADTIRTLTVELSDVKSELEQAKQKLSRVLMTSASETKDGSQHMELLEKVKNLECDLERSNKNFEEVADEINRWKQEYTRQFEECENLKAEIVQGERLMTEQKENYDQEISKLSTQLNTLMNSSTMSTPGLNATGKKKKVRELEEQRNSYILLCSEREQQVKELEEQLESLRQSQGVVSTVKVFEHEMKWMKEKMEKAQKQHDILNENYDSLEKAYEDLQKEHELQVSSNRSSTDYEEEIQTLKKKLTELSRDSIVTQDSGVTSKDSSTSEEGSLHDRLVVLERENNELRFRLRALNAPAEKEVKSLREEISLANTKVTHLKAELRRLQNTKNLDSTICEMKGHSSRDHKDQLEAGNFDYSSGSGVVMEVQVLHLKNMVYHLEKDKKQMQNECKIMEQHVDHYKKKAQEWKDTATKEKKIGEKMSKDLESKRAEIKMYQASIKENQGFNERQKFELGQQRETIAKLEKEKQEHLEKIQATSTAVTNSMRRQTIAAMKESSSEFSKGASNIEEGKVSSTSVAPDLAGRQMLLGNHNAPLPSQRRIERLPGVIASADTQKTDGKVPMWQSLYKENKDYSKYYLPKTSKKEEEDCKQQ